MTNKKNLINISNCDRNKIVRFDFWAYPFLKTPI